MSDIPDTDTLEMPTANYGPAMRACNSRQRKFVLSLLMSGDDNYTRAARYAGYSNTNANVMSVTAHRLSHDPKIQAAIQEESKRRLHAGLVLASSRLVEHIKNPDGKISLKAIEMVMNRAGIHAQSEHKVTVEHQMNEGEQIKSIIMMAEAMGIDPSVMLGSAGYKVPQLEAPRQEPMPVIEGEYEEVAANLEGLEDIL